MPDNVHIVGQCCSVSLNTSYVVWILLPDRWEFLWLWVFCFCLFNYGKVFSCILVCSGCQSRIPQTLWPRHQQFIFSSLWWQKTRIKVPVSVSAESFLPDLQTTAFSRGPHGVFPWCPSISLILTNGPNSKNSPGGGGRVLGFNLCTVQHTIHSITHNVDKGRPL